MSGFVSEWPSNILSIRGVNEFSWFLSQYSERAPKNIFRIYRWFYTYLCAIVIFGIDNPLQSWMCNFAHNSVGIYSWFLLIPSLIGISCRFLPSYEQNCTSSSAVNPTIVKTTVKFRWDLRWVWIWSRFGNLALCEDDAREAGSDKGAAGLNIFIGLNILQVPQYLLSAIN